MLLSFTPLSLLVSLLVVVGITVATAEFLQRRRTLGDLALGHAATAPLISVLAIRLHEAEKTCALPLHRAILRALGDELLDGAPFRSAQSYESWLSSLRNARDLAAQRAQTRVLLGEAEQVAILLRGTARVVLGWKT